MLFCYQTYRCLKYCRTGNFRVHEIFANFWKVEPLSASSLLSGNIGVQEIFREFRKIRETRENFLHAKICCSTVYMTTVAGKSTYTGFKTGHKPYNVANAVRYINHRGLTSCEPHRQLTTKGSALKGLILYSSIFAWHLSYSKAPPAKDLVTCY